MHERVQCSLNPLTQELRGTATLLFAPLTDQLTHLAFNASSQLKLHRVRVNDQESEFDANPHTTTSYLKSERRSDSVAIESSDANTPNIKLPLLSELLCVKSLDRHLEELEDATESGQVSIPLSAQLRDKIKQSKLDKVKKSPQIQSNNESITSDSATQPETSSAQATDLNNTSSTSDQRANTTQDEDDEKMDVSTADEQKSVLDTSNNTASSPSLQSATATATSTTSPLLMPIKVSVDFSVLRPRSGLHFHTVATKSHGKTLTHVQCHTSTSASLQPSLWFPCCEHISQRATFDWQMTVPEEYTLIMSGTEQHKSTITTTQADFPHFAPGTRLVRHEFAVSQPCLARHQGFVCAPLQSQIDRQLSQISFHCMHDDTALLLHTMQQTQHSQQHIYEDMLKLYEEALQQSWPLVNYAVCFIDSPHSETLHYANFTVCSRALLHSARIIDAHVPTRQALAYALAWSWVGVLLSTQSESEVWILHGICHHLTQRYMESVTGRNECTWRLLQRAHDVMAQDCDQFLAFDDPKLPPSMASDTVAVAQVMAAQKTSPLMRRYCDERALYTCVYLHPSELSTPTFIDKAACVMSMLERKLGEAKFINLIKSIMTESAVTAMDPERDSSSQAQVHRNNQDESEVHNENEPENEIELDLSQEATSESRSAPHRVHIQPLSTLRFIELSQSLSSDSTQGELIQFFNQWLLTSEYSFVDVASRYNARKKCIALRVAQASEGLSFYGLLKLRLAEVERVSSQERRVAVPTEHFDFPVMSKIRRNRKRKQYTDEEMKHLSLNVLLQRHNDTPLLYTRADVDCTFSFAPLQVYQSEVHHILQLSNERDIVGQSIAVQNCAMMLREGYNVLPALDVDAEDDDAAAQHADGLGTILHLDLLTQSGKHLSAMALNDAMCARENSVRIRIEAARGLAMATTIGEMQVHNSELGSSPAAAYRKMLFTHITDLFFDATGSRPKPNDFTDTAKYELQKALPDVLARTYESSGLSSPATVQLILLLLEENNNSDNLFSDSQYLCVLLRCASRLKLPQQDSRRKHIESLIQHQLRYDSILLSHRRCVTCAALQAICHLERQSAIRKEQHASNRLTADGAPVNHAKSRTGQTDYLDFFALDSGYGRDVRITAWECCLSLIPHRDNEWCSTLLTRLESEQSAGMQTDMIVCWCRAILNRDIKPHQYRVQDAKGFNRHFARRIWHIVNTTCDVLTRDAAFRLYRCIWGATGWTPASLWQFDEQSASRLLGAAFAVTFKVKEHSVASVTQRRDLARKHLAAQLAKRAVELRPSNAQQVHSTPFGSPIQAGQGGAGLGGVGAIKLKKSQEGTYKAQETISHN